MDHHHQKIALRRSFGSVQRRSPKFFTGIQTNRTTVAFLSLTPIASFVFLRHSLVQIASTTAAPPFRQPYLKFYFAPSQPSTTSTTAAPSLSHPCLKLCLVCISGSLVGFTASQFYTVLLLFVSSACVVL